MKITIEGNGQEIRKMLQAIVSSKEQEKKSVGVTNPLVKQSDHFSRLVF